MYAPCTRARVHIDPSKLVVRHLRTSMATRCTITDYETSGSEIQVSKPMIIQVKYRFGRRARRSGSTADCQELLQGLRLIVGGTCEPGFLPRYVSQELFLRRVDGCMLIEGISFPMTLGLRSHLPRLYMESLSKPLRNDPWIHDGYTGT
jgi:hypothetical protein